MRDYAKVAPKFWTGRTGKALKVAGPEAVIVAMYLMTSPHANMIGLYHCPVAYIAIDTGLSLEGASKGLASCIEADFCQYDDSIEYVFVVEFAKYQLGDELDPKDKRCQGVANELAKVPKCLLHNSFRAHYAVPYHLPLPKPHASPLKAPPKPGAGAGAGAGEDIGAKAPHPDESGNRRPEIPCPYAQIVALYHDLLPSLPKAKLMTAARQRGMRKLWGWVLSSTKGDGSRRATSADEALQWFSGYFGRAAENDFLMGRTPRSAEHKDWRCDIDFLMTDKGLRQVIERTQDAV